MLMKLFGNSEQLVLDFDGDSDRVADAGIFRRNSDHCGIWGILQTEFR